MRRSWPKALACAVITGVVPSLSGDVALNKNDPHYGARYSVSHRADAYVSGCAAVWTGLTEWRLRASATSPSAENGIGAESPLSEVRAGDFRRIYRPPDRDGVAWYINDHCFIQAEDGVWHLFGITQSEPGKPQQERFFAHATSRDLLAAQWKTEPDVLQVDVSKGETLVWAPHVVRHEGLYYLFYCAGGEGSNYRLHLATSRDLFRWERHPANPLLVDGYHARDPMVCRIGDQWVLYYTATNPSTGGNHVVRAVTSRDLVHWNEPRVVFTHPRTGTFGGPTESPYVVQRAGRYYLFICENPPYNSTAIYVSGDPFNWPIAARVGAVPAHAAEVVILSSGRSWVSRAGWGQGGVYLAELYWPQSSAGLSGDAGRLQPRAVSVGLAVPPDLRQVGANE